MGEVFAAEHEIILAHPRRRAAQPSDTVEEVDPGEGIVEADPLLHVDVDATADQEESAGDPPRRVAHGREPVGHQHDVGVDVDQQVGPRRHPRPGEQVVDPWRPVDPRGQRPEPHRPGGGRDIPQALDVPTEQDLDVAAELPPAVHRVLLDQPGVAAERLRRGDDRDACFPDHAPSRPRRSRTVVGDLGLAT
ncbi:MAG: hypothetical protein EBR28_07955 [Planctomycetia bacterium]|nr:hypothetical protein [Planctomycetia bacterium]